MRKPFWIAAMAAAAVLGGTAQADERVVLVGRIEGVINPVTAQYVDRVVSEGERRGVAAVVFEIDTPGGLVSSTFRITTRFLSAKVPVITYVSPSGARAASAGTFITMAGHIAAMAPATNIGAAHPVDSSGGNIEGDLRDKIVNDTVAEAQKIALARGRNAEWAERAVRQSVSVHDEEALALDVVDLVARDVREVLDRADGRAVTLGQGEVRLALREVPLEPNPVNPIERFLHTISDPQIALLLFTIGTYGLIFELSNPSLIFPGVIGVVAIILALFALGTLDASAAGLALLLFALILFVSEIWVSSHGILTAGGILALVLAGLLLFPPWNPTLPGFRLSIHPLVIASAAAIPAAFFVLILRSAFEIRRAPALSGTEMLLGAVGIAQSDLAPEGVVKVGGEDWSAYVERGEVAKGDRIRVRRIDSVRLVVEPAEREARET